MSRRAAPFARLSVVAVLVAAQSASAATPADVAARADALFRAAKSLRDAGKLPEACAAFAESKQLEAGIGVTLYLADCYEQIGKAGSAWAEFHDAETRAREKKDKRADVAHARAAAIEPRLGHLGIAISPANVPPGAEIEVDDGDALAPSSWTTIAVDSGEHVVKLRVGGKVVRAAPAKVSAGKWAIVRLDPPPLTSASPPAAATTGAGAADPSLKIETRQAVGYSLLAAGAIGTALGAGLLVAKNHSLSTGAPNGPATVNQSDASGSDIAFAVGGAAFAAAIILYLTAPTQKDTAIVVAPGPLTGGAGAFLSARF